ncbi:uncharacterized protein EV420DRAFT_692169 [Desarmillaria tabescens]|uniref:Uncharacterized protein n=1 Tax=Armillaria tabescens TaxID=1929756 RepID=A0AA39MZZ3_ARMTA|nr:uncharacterized protein EV420DRAFT_692169 [Desarmillaria tabescens]KAK0452105.1 hypothetical protein EV420DRAFT_692169 [Desarmillaria tabescens]
MFLSPPQKRHIPYRPTSISIFATAPSLKFSRDTSIVPPPKNKALRPKSLSTLYDSIGARFPSQHLAHRQSLFDQKIHIRFLYYIYTYVVCLTKTQKIDKEYNTKIVSYKGKECVCYTVILHAWVSVGREHKRSINGSKKRGGDGRAGMT